MDLLNTKNGRLEFREGITVIGIGWAREFFKQPYEI